MINSDSRSVPEFLKPTPDLITEAFWDGLKEHRLLIQRCSQCAKFQFPPLPACRSCLSSLEWVDSKGTGTLYTWTVVRRATHSILGTWVPYVLAIIRMDEGVLFCSHVMGETPESLRADMPVRVHFVLAENGYVFPVFRVDELSDTDSRGDK